MFGIFGKDWRQTSTFEGAALHPLGPASRPPRVLGGVWHKDLPDAFHQRRATTDRTPGTDANWLAAQPAPTERLTGHGLYAGPFFAHYGHFIAESVHRLWAWVEAPDTYDYLAVLPQLRQKQAAPKSVADLPAFQRDLLAYVGVPEAKVKLVATPVLADRLTVPRQARLFGPKGRTPKGYADFWAGCEQRFFAGYAAPLPDTQDRIYVSRANYLASGSLAGEYYLERQLAAEGFFILRPETLPLTTQLHLYRHAKLLVFAEGSAMHTTELLGPLAADIVILMRRPHADALWRGALKANSLTIFDKVIQLPPIDRANDGSLATHRSMSLLDAPALVAALRADGIARLPQFDLAAFQEAEAGDVARYLLNVTLRDTGDELADRFIAFRDAFARHDNPYLMNSLPAGADDDMDDDSD